MDNLITSRRARWKVFGIILIIICVLGVIKGFVSGLPSSRPAPNSKEPVQTQSPPADSILIGSSRLTLGMPKEAVIDTLKSSYDVRPSGEDGDLYFQTKGKREHFSPEGFLSFGNEKLTDATKLWNANEPDTSNAVTHAILGATSSLADNKAPCFVIPFHSQKPSEEKKGVTISCGDQNVDIFTTSTNLNGTWHEFTIVNESLRSTLR